MMRPDCPNDGGHPWRFKTWQRRGDLHGTGGHQCISELDRPTRWWNDCKLGSERIGSLSFVTRKVTRAVAAIKLGRQQRLFLGNLDAKRDWAHARDYVEGMWRIVQQPEPDDYVLATGEAHSVREFVEKAFAQIDIQIEWMGAGVDEKGVDAASGRVLVEIDRRYFRPTEVDTLIGHASKARSKLGWHHKVSFNELVAEMVATDLKTVASESSRQLTSHD